MWVHLSFDQFGLCCETEPIDSAAPIQRVERNNSTIDSVEIDKQSESSD